MALATAIVLVPVQTRTQTRPTVSGTRIVRGGAGPGVDGGLRLEPSQAVRAAQTAAQAANPTQRNPRYVPGDLIVKYADGGSPTAAQWDAAQRVGARERSAPPFGNFSVLELDAGVDPEVAAAAMRDFPGVEYAQPNYLRQPLFVPDDPLFVLQWNLMQVGMERAWDINTAAGESVTVAVIDSGLAFQDTVIEFQADAFSLRGRNFPALGTVNVPFATAFDIVTPERIVAPFDFVWMDEFPVDLSGHGTHVTGTLGQLTDNDEGAAGVAFNVQIMPLKVLADEWDFIFGASPACCGGTDANVASAIRYAVQFGADVINMSLGGPDVSPVIDDAMRFAVGQGVFIAIAGGNSFEEGNATIWPAATAENIDGAISVAAVNRQSRRAFYSNTGTYVEIAAPGGDQRRDAFDGVVQQTLDPDFSLTFERPVAQFGPPRFDVLSYVFFQGSSMAAPHVAGVAAMLRAQGVTDPAAIEAGLKATAQDIGAPGEDTEFGAGLLDGGAALRGLGIAR